MVAYNPVHRSTLGAAGVGRFSCPNLDEKNPAPVEIHETLAIIGQINCFRWISSINNVTKT